MSHPITSTYRLQFHKGFTFKDATAIVGYLADLGITHAYASPYLRAAAGSTNGLTRWQRRLNNAYFQGRRQTDSCSLTCPIFCGQQVPRTMLRRRG